MVCLTEESLIAFADGALDGLALDSAVGHLDTCDECRRIVALIAGGGARNEPSPTPSRIMGRYVLLNIVGAGAMGVVYRAYDPELDRKVALKILRPDRVIGSARELLLREAQALARVSHPNVIAVHDVGSEGEDLFVAMELVDGPTLRQWLADRRRSVTEILSVMSAVGRGLSAAHASGLVHQDFKPENVLIGRDGRSRVTDFGLAMVAEMRGGISAGTPAYMAPEQLDGGQVDARSDQFGFCVVLWEALFGERPYSGSTLEELREGTRAGCRKPPPAGVRVPTRIRRALERGFSPAADDRFATMGDLLQQIDRGLTFRARHVWLAAGLVAAGAVSVLALSRLPTFQEGKCRGADQRLAGVWDPARRQSVELAFRTTRKPFAADAFHGVESALDQYTQAWVLMRTEACLTTKRGEQSAELLDLRMACLDRRLGDVAALTSLLSRADVKTVEHAAEAVSALGDLKECADRARLTAVVPPPDPATKSAVHAVRSRLAEAKALRDAGWYSRAVDLATDALASAKQTSYQPVQAEALFALGDAQAKAGDYSGGDSTLQLALWASESARWDELAARAALRLAQVTGGNQQLFAQANLWSNLAASKVARFDRRADLAGAVAYTRAMLLQRQGEWTESLTRCREALPLLVSAHGERSPRVAEVERLMGTLLLEKGDLTGARVHHEKALAIWTQVLGPSHPDIALSLNNLGHVLAASGAIAEAEQTHLRGLEVARAALGNDHPYLANAQQNLASVAVAKGDLGEAEALAARALEIRVRAYGSDHPLVAGSLGLLGEIARRRGDPHAAMDMYDRSLGLLSKALPPDHPGLALPLAGIGQARLDSGDPGGARKLLEQALQLRGEHPGEPLWLASSRFALARALILTGGDPAWARHLGDLASNALGELGATAQQERAAVERWLAENSPKE